MLVGNMAVASDDEVLRHAIDAPVVGYPSVASGARASVRIAYLVQPASGIIRTVLVVEPVHGHGAFFLEPHQQRVLLSASDAPGSEDVDQRHLVFEVIGRQAKRASLHGRQMERRNRASEER